jgi:hypothetical protein
MSHLCNRNPDLYVPIQTRLAITFDLILMLAFQHIPNQSEHEKIYSLYFSGYHCSAHLDGYDDIEIAYEKT